MQSRLSTMTAPLPRVEEEQVMPIDSKQSTVPSDFTARRIAVFGSIVSTILLSANAPVCATWSYFFGLSGWIAWQALPGALAVAFIPATILRFRSAHPALRMVYALTAAWVGALNFVFFAAVACWIVEGAAWLSGWPLPRFQLAAILFSLALLETVYGLVNA